MNSNLPQKIHILLVEDSPIQTELLRQQLCDEQFEIHCVNSVSKIRPFLSQKKVDIVLLDLRLPDSEGINTYTECRAQAPDVPIVILTVTSDDEVALEAIRQGAHDFLVKANVDKSVILRVIRYSLVRHESQKEILTLSLTDDLTGLNNRRAFHILAEGQLRLAERNRGSCILFFLDIDGFKKINDRLGHPAGDNYLKALTGILQSTFRDSDIIARMGGDEFAVLALNVKEEDSTTIPTRLDQNLIAYNMNHSGDFLPLSISYGMAIFHHDNPQPLDILIQEADEKMYAQKHIKKSQAGKS